MLFRSTLAFLALLNCGNAFTTVHHSRHSTSLMASNSNELLPMRQGSSCAIITPMHSDGKIDIPSLRKIFQYHLAAGTDNLCVLGTTGEASVMSMDERAQVLKVAVEEVKGKIPILAGTGTIRPESVKDMTLQAMDIGCDASLVVTPYYVKPPQRGLIKHFTDMADLGLPVVMYNIPGRSKVDLTPESTAICADHENIIGLKDATGELDRVEQIRSLLRDPDNFLLYSGDDSTSAEFVLRGGDGCISVTANVAAEAMHNLMMAALAKDEEAVKRINEPLLGLHKKLFVESSPIPAKWACSRIGLTKTPYCRPPLAELDPKFYSDVETALEAAGLTGFDVKVPVPANGGVFEIGVDGFNP
mmetsp:Transcript_31193/g.65908  ORF Transcript_31193/g.65908 Transcript_31193/m.65908 type:complete len:359 (+) Transcript_31193:141-1217(+)|eukprot:CAMPEP_0171328158 /NCGR_PEP_ID=MMETSP0878-20121228/479_1 /TAXON_ID=67004 /ORGANISM="Thalassiosira weissflogii, Strain CCMP1336" /LENGTH=358 /DNA_ID=CAMNT_0011827987 /DNA_START=98 /DNA_END=1174 /DNA_ORIENTATION=-